MISGILAKVGAKMAVESLALSGMRVTKKTAFEAVFWNAYIFLHIIGDG